MAFLSRGRSARAAGALSRLLAPACALALLASPVLSAEDTQAQVEYRVKAAFLYNFTKFVMWPDDAFQGEKDPLRICVFGEDPFGGSLDAIVRGETADGRPLVIDRGRQLDDLGTCHVLFVSRSERGRLKEIFDAVDGDSVLTVGDSPGFLERGGMINFTLEGSKLRFAIDQAAAERVRLRISSKLLRLAVHPREDRG